jgi:hypothetical protein
MMDHDIVYYSPMGCRLSSEGTYVNLVQAKLRNEAPVNGGRNYNGPKVAKFLVG